MAKRLVFWKVWDKKCAFLLGLEESCGYFSGTYVYDKDGVNAAILVCEMAAYYKNQNKTLLDIFYEIYNKHGYFLDKQISYQFSGEQGLVEQKKIMNS